MKLDANRAVCITCLMVMAWSGIETKATYDSYAATNYTEMVEINNTYKANVTFRKYGHGLSESFAQFVAGSFLIIIIVAVSCNLILITTIIAVDRLHTYTHVFIVNLAVSDLITVLGTVPFDVEFMLRGYFPHGKVACGIMHTNFLISLPSSVLSLTLLTGERFISVVFPFRLARIITKKRVIFAVLITWIYTLLVALFPIIQNPKGAILILDGVCYLAFDWSYQIFQVVVNFMIPIIFICGVNATLLLVSHQHANKTAWIISQIGVFQDSPTNNNRLSVNGKSATSKQAISCFTRNLKAAKRIALLVGVFLICWLSYIILAAINYKCSCHPRELTWMANVVNYSSAAIDPVLYGLMNKFIRREIFGKLRQIGKTCFPSVQWSNTACSKKTKEQCDEYRDSILLKTI